MEHHFRRPAGNLRHKTPRKFLLKAVITLAILAGIIGWYQFTRYDYFIKTPVDPTDDAAISFMIKKGESLNEIAANLKGKNIILDEGAFKNYLRWNGLDRSIVAGRFLLNKTQTIPDIAKTVTDAKQSEFVVTVPEGSTISDIDKKLVELEVIQAGEFIAATRNFQDYGKYHFLEKEKIEKLSHPLEGYLFPDTYFIDPNNFHSEDLIQLMLNNFKKKLGDELNKEQSRSLFEIITMASMVEKEVRTEKDLPVVAGILWKRLDNGWMLGADATLLYLKDDRSIDYKDLQEDSPYNTRNHKGLPPGPISNPGLKSIFAAMYPQESRYFYYLTKPETGEVVYAATNDEHNANKAKYLY